MDVTSNVQILGSPFTKSTFAKNVWDMQVFNGHIYLGHGDFNTSSGPIPVIYFDPATSKFVTHFTVDEEEINVFRVVNGKLFIPGIDARDDWNFGNIYAIGSNNSWIKYRTVPQAAHVFDIAYFHGKLYTVTGTTGTCWGEVLVSEDMGVSWQSQVPGNASNWLFTGNWGISLFELGGKLYAAGRMLFLSPAELAGNSGNYARFVEIDGDNAQIQLYSKYFAPGIDLRYGYYLKKNIVFHNQLVFICQNRIASNWKPNSMYAAISLDKSRKIVFPETSAVPADILNRDSSIYVLTFIKTASKNYTNIIYKSSDLENWTEVFRFNTDTFARSFEELNGHFYFGLGCDADYVSPNTGNILKVAQGAY
ncbi:hypothetical protein [Dehalobacter sp.]|uniref:hypothetical protein n=1 Tax=Dehalobacter sp. TaxID=1962289 RepID=UPI002583C854|nr:hypothetical protein [Dehalobacter sp.]MDJ0304940.1 hypothetical protein [Dehalobacter sp.]